MPKHHLFRRTPLLATGAALLAGALALTGCASADSGGDKAEALTMWVRSGTAAQSEALVEAWNAKGGSQIALTVIPNENYMQKVGVAAGSGDLPDLLTSDGVFTPNYTSQGLFADLTDRLASLEFSDSLVRAQVEVGTRDGKQYAVPHTVAISAILQNDVLLRKAGIDPEAPLEDLGQLAENAAKVKALGDGAEGLYLTGNNGGSIGFTIFPAVWASGGEVLNPDGTETLTDSAEAVGVFEVLNKMYQDGTIPEAAREETGATRDEVFASGRYGYLLGSNSVVTNVPDSENIEVGVQGIPGLNGGQSTYVGGDVAGISASSDQVDSAWEFLAWTLGEEAQLDVFAKNGFLLSRTDLGDNEYFAEDPRLVALNDLIEEGRVPFALQYGQTFSDANGPWIVAARAALFGTEGAAAPLAQSVEEINSSLRG